MENNATTLNTSWSDIRLIVKSANQQCEDLIVDTEPHWTIGRLKVHLTKVYPLNPSVSEQKLIYSGQLLSDELILKDILRSYKDVETENHIFHLVYTPKMKPKSLEQNHLSQKSLQKSQFQKNKLSIETPSTSAEGLRQRNITSRKPVSTVEADNSASQAQQLISQVNPTTVQQTVDPVNAGGCPANFPTIGFGTPNPMQFMLPGQINGDTPTQHAAAYNWMQQIYSNYMDQCLRMANMSVDVNQMADSTPNAPMFMPIPQFMPPSSPISMSGSGIPNGNIPSVNLDGPSTSRSAIANLTPRIKPVIPAAGLATAQPQQAAGTDGANPTPNPEPAQAQNENIEQPQPRFPNVIQDEQDDRDWLDSFYSVTRLMALLTLVYFYSSPIRCFAVASIAAGIYLYHIGFFQTRRVVVVNNENNNNNNRNVNAPAEIVAQDQDANNANATRETSSSSESASSSGPESHATSVISFVRTFVVSFFASLLPETPAL